jgi:hypothetical protein
MIVYYHMKIPYYIRVITKLPNSEQSYKGKINTPNSFKKIHRAVFSIAHPKYSNFGVILDARW